ncbi:MAG: hypothetical protein ABH817_01195 [archaeon]
METEGKIHISDLKIKKNKQSENFYFELEKKFKENLFKDALSITKFVTKLAKEIGIKSHNLEDIKTRKVISLNTLKKMSVFLIKNGFKQYSLKKIEKKISYIKGGFTQNKIYIKFPVNLKCKEGIRLISHLYHDGGIGKKNRQPKFTNKIRKEVEKFILDGRKIFGRFDRKVKENRNKGGNIVYIAELPTVIGDILISIGYGKGDKTKNNPKIFGFLNRLKEKNLISIFISTAINDDGHIGNRVVSIQQSTLIKKGKKKVSNILMLDKLMLEKLGLVVVGPKIAGTYKNRYGICANFKISFYGKNQFNKFYKTAKRWLVPYKKTKLEKLTLRTAKGTL